MNWHPARRITRRHFLATAGPLVLPPGSALGYRANERLNLAIVGVWGYASAAAFVPGMHLYDNVELVALCDVDRRKVAPAFKLWEDRARAWPTSEKPEERKAAGVYRKLAERHPPLVADYRRLFDGPMGKGIDAVVVATPDHTHAPASAEALHAGKHVFCEKPLTITVHESRALRALAARQKVATSMGNQGTQSPQFRRGLELVREGVLGDVREVHVWFDRGGRGLKAPPKGGQPVPPELDWDLWLGPVAWREYHPEWIARTHWRETSAGQLGNFGPHTANLAFMALNVADLWAAKDARIGVEAEAPETNRLSFPLWERIRWHVPARGMLPPVTVTWHQGPGLAPGSRNLIEGLLRDRGATDEDVNKLLLYAGAIVVGSKGALVTDSHNVNVTLLPRDRYAGTDTAKPRAVPASRGHYQDWIHACRGGAAPFARFEYAATLNEFLMLGDGATRFPGDRLEYDPAAGRVVNHAEANQALSYEYRKGWRL